MILFEDECKIRDYQAITATWFLKGQQRIVKTYGHHIGVGIFGVIDYFTGDIIYSETETLDAQSFLEFLTKMANAYPGKKIKMILDNGRIHYARLLKEFKEKNKCNLEFIFLPPYSPNLNRIEGLWKWLKETVIYNAFYKTRKEISNVIKRFMDTISKDRAAIIKRLCW